MACDSDPKLPIFRATLSDRKMCAVCVRLLLLPVTAQRYNLANFDRRSGANALIHRNHFHDSCGSGGRVILKALNASFISNTVERSGGVHVYSEQEWLEGDLGIRNMYPHATWLDLILSIYLVDTVHLGLKLRVRSEPSHLVLFMLLISLHCSLNCCVSTLTEHAGISGVIHWWMKAHRCTLM